MSTVKFQLNKPSTPTLCGWILRTKALAIIILVAGLYFFIATSAFAADIQLTCDHLDIAGTSCYFYSDEHSISYTESDGFINPYPDTSAVQFHSGSSGTINAFSYPVNGDVYDWNRWTVGGDYYYLDRTAFEVPVVQSVTINTPVDTITLGDFSQWNVSWENIDEDFIVSIHYSDDEDIITTCTDFPTGISAGYTECINGNPKIFVDYGPSFSAGVGTATANIIKNTGLTIGKTYYAQAVVQEDDAYGFPIVSSNIISFTIGVPNANTPTIVACTTFDIFCHLKNAFIWAFIPSDSSLQSFLDLKELIMSKKPFSYISQIPDLFESLFNSDETEWAIDIPFFPTNQDIAFLAYDTPDSLSFYPFLMGLVTMGLLLGFAWYVYKRAMGIFDTLN